jgi:hypothetical protein
MSGPLITQVQKLYEVWAVDSELRDALGQSPTRVGRSGSSR